MPRFFSAVCLVWAGLLPLYAFALGLGEIDLRSALNQPFVAEIPVTSDSADEVAGLRVNLASADTFDQYGLDRPAFLGDLAFAVVTRQGRTIVRITSSQPVTEPFVTMLLEVRWPQGRLLREYTVLLDPPVLAAGAGRAAIPAPSRPSSPAVRREEPTSTRAQPSARAEPPPARFGSDTFGPVQRNATLWGIAQRLRPSASVSMNQMMLAIYRANPEAFVGNINRLKAGAILRVPDAAEIGQLGRSEAFAEVRRQNETWRGTIDRSGEESARLRLVPPPEPATAEPPSVRPTGTGAASAEDAELRRRVTQLEDQLADSERLIGLKDEELQALQQRLAALQDRMGVEEQVVPAAEPAAADVAVDERVAAEPALVDSEVPVEPEAPAAPEDVEPAVAPPPPTSTTVVTSAEEQSWLGALFGSIWLYVGIGLVLVATLFTMRRRSAQVAEGRWEAVAPEPETSAEEGADSTDQLRVLRAPEETFVVEESAAGPPTEAFEAEPPAAEAPVFETAEAAAISAEDELPLERTISAEGAVDLDQADPLAEADFHMAYGLYDQAADLLTNALTVEPDRKDLRLKLLEVYFVWENRGGFLKEAQLLRERTDPASDPDWNKVLIMGRQICPDEELFADAGAAVAPDEMDFSVGEETGGSVDLVLGDEEGGLDFDLGAASAGDELGEGLDFDIPAEVPGAPTPTIRVEPGAEGTLEAPTVEYQQPESATLETPTIESPQPGSGTVETPTIESPQPESRSVETPTIEAEMAGVSPTLEAPAAPGTLETPTIESMPPMGGEGDQTAEIDLDDLGLDLTGLDEAADEIATGLHEVPDEIATGLHEIDPSLAEAAASGDESLDWDTAARQLDVSGLAEAEESVAPDATAAFDLGGQEFSDHMGFGGLADSESTAEMQSLGEPAEEGPDVEALRASLENGPDESTGDTVEQPALATGDTLEQPAADSGLPAELLAAGSDVDLDLDLGLEGAGAEIGEGATTTVDFAQEGPTMTEVGTKLDLARAYLDMGDPDGARSILDEVLEEGDDGQRQEAQKLLDDLAV
jgi:pilus assembly protein FimV